jgi:hypothetical protein
MGASIHFFDNKDVDWQVKKEIYIAGPLNALLWGCETWNLMKSNLDRLRSFHHGAIRRILNIKWQQVQEDHIKNKEVRKHLFNIPNIDVFINRRTAAYLGKVTRSNNNTFPRKFLAAWVNASRKNGAPQLTCNNNFAVTIDLLLKKSKPLSSKQAPLKEWIPLAKDEANWKFYLDAYFEACCNIEEEEDNNSDWEEDEEAQDIPHPMNRETDK